MLLMGTSIELEDFIIVQKVNEFQLTSWPKQFAIIYFFCQVDASAVNLRLQYSSYFLFVMVITCVLYGMIKGRPVKQTFNKKVFVAKYTGKL